MWGLKRQPRFNSDLLDNTSCAVVWNRLLNLYYINFIKAHLFVFFFLTSFVLLFWFFSLFLSVHLYRRRVGYGRLCFMKRKQSLLCICLFLICPQLPRANKLSPNRISWALLGKKHIYKSFWKQNFALMLRILMNSDFSNSRLYRVGNHHHRITIGERVTMLLTLPLM